MADNKKYYYLKLKENFYDSEALIILQNMPDGYLYSDILMKLYLRSLKNNGKLMFKDVIPYTPTALAQVVRHQVGTVEKAIEIFKQLGLIEVLDNGAIYMLDIQSFIGESSTEADRIRNYRAKIKNDVQMLQQMYDKSTPEIEIEKEIDKDIEKEIDKDIEKEIDKDIEKEIDKDIAETKVSSIEKKHKYGEYQNVLLKDTEYQKLKEEYQNADELIKFLDEYIEMKGYKAKSHYLCIKKWVVDAVKKQNHKNDIEKELEDWLKDD